jgi:hypothetical protein
MTNEELKKVLKSFGGFWDVFWIENRNAEDMWADCQDADWMLKLLQKLGLNNRRLTLAKAKCAETFQHSDRACINAVEVAIRYGCSEATEEELYAAYAEASEVVEWYERALEKAWDAAYYTDDADDIYADCTDIVKASLESAKIAAGDVNANYYSNKKAHRLIMANICREIVPYSELLVLLREFSKEYK